MSQNLIDIRYGISEGRAMKAPCLTVTTANHPLSGLAPINGVTLTDGARILVAAQTDATQNGIWSANSGNWRRAADFNGNRDVLKGTQVYVTATSDQYYVTNADPVTVDSSEIGFALVDLTAGDGFVRADHVQGFTADEMLQARANIGAAGVPVVDVTKHGAVGDGDPDRDDGPALNLAINELRELEQQGGINPTKPGVLWCPPGKHFVIRTPLDCTALRQANFYAYWNGATIWGKTAGKPVVDGVGSQNFHWSDLTIRGDEDDRPSIGMQIGRETSDAARGVNYFSGMQFVGFFTKAAFVNSAAEVTSFINCTFRNRDQRRSSYAFVVDSDNSMDLDTDSPYLASNYIGLHFESVTEPDTNWGSSEVIRGQVSGARRIRRTRKIGNLYISAVHVTDVDSPYFGQTNTTPFIVGETVEGLTSNKEGVISSITNWARAPGDEQSCANISFLNCDFRKSDLLAQQRGTGPAIRIFGGPPGEAQGTVKQLNFTQCYSPVLDTANILVSGNLFNSKFDFHCETQQPVNDHPTLLMVVVDENRDPVTTLQVGEILTGEVSGVTAEVMGYVGDQVEVSVTPVEVPLTGTHSIEQGSRTLNGTGTEYTTELSKGDAVKIVDTGDILVIQTAPNPEDEDDDDFQATTYAPALTTAVNSAAVRLDDKFLLDEPIIGPNGLVGTCDSGFGPRHMIEVETTQQVWFEDVEIRDHNPHAWQSVIAKRGNSGGAPLTMNNCHVSIRSTHHDVPVFQQTQGSGGPGGSYAPIEFHGQLNVGEGGNQDTEQLRNLSALRRLDGIVYSEVSNANNVTLPDNGDVIVFASGSNASLARARIRMTGRVRGNLECRFGSAIVSASVLELAATDGNLASVTGNNSITDLGAAEGGIFRILRFTGTPILVHDGTKLILPNGGRNIDVRAGDVAFFISLGAGNWRCYFYQRADGSNLGGQIRSVNTRTASYVVALDDAGKVISMNVAGANTLTIPPHSTVAFPVGTYLYWEQYGAGQTTITPGAGVTLRAYVGLKSAGLYAAGTLYQRALDEWVVAGDLAV